MYYPKLTYVNSELTYNNNTINETSNNRTFDIHLSKESKKRKKGQEGE